jgi:hypothetical protein
MAPVKSSVYLCVRAFVRACVCAYLRACVRSCVRACVPKVQLRERIKGQLDEISYKSYEYRVSTRDMNVIIRNLLESMGEHLQSTVQDLMTDIMKPRDAGFSGEERQ